MAYRILLVEPDSAVAAAAAEVLTDADHRVATVESFADAIKLSEPDAPDLLIAALRLGAFNGLHLLLRVRGHDADLPVIILGEPDDFSGDIERFGGRFVAKPIDFSSLRNIVWDCLAGRVPRQTQNGRTWPRKPTHLPATVRDEAARVVELSYGGVRLEFAEPPKAEDAALDIKLPSLGLSVRAVTRWSRLAAGGSWWCGAEVALPTTDATRTWRRIVDSVN
jgi:CheY-like chemotaxis protein